MIRVAGNIIAPSLVGSVEFAAARFGTPLVVVLGHTQCGAIAATVEELTQQGGTQSPNLSSIVNRVRPSVLPLMNTELRHDLHALSREAVRANIRASTNHLRHGSELMENLIEQKGFRVVGAEYSLETASSISSIWVSAIVSSVFVLAGAARFASTPHRRRFPTRRQNMASKRNKNQTAFPAGKAHAVWLAGLGAVSIAQKRGTEVLSGLAAEGRDFQARAQQLVREVGADARVHVKGVVAPLRVDLKRNAAKLGVVVQSAVATVLAKLGIPSKADIEALSQRMSALSRQLKAAK